MSMSSNTNESSFSLKFVVVGGGVAGLATATTLRRAGHRVVVLEKKSETDMFFRGPGCGIRSPPNMTKLLYRWGLGPTLSQIASRCERLVYINADSGGLLGAIVLDEEFLRELITDMILIQHADLVRILQDLAVWQGVEIRFDANVVYGEQEGPSVTLDTGETIRADIVILADGCSSSLRSTMTKNPPDPRPGPGAARVLFLTFAVDVDFLKDDETFSDVLEPNHWLTWIAEDTIVNTYVMEEEGLVVGALSREYYGDVVEGDEEWSDAVDLRSYGLDFTAFDPRLRKIFEHSRSVSGRIFLKRRMPDEFVNDYSSVVLVGEAAHPLVCDGSHGTALVIEDAETLGSLFTGIRSRSEISQLLMAYEEIRLPRCQQTYLHHERLNAIMKLPVGPQQRSRDIILRRTLAYTDFNRMDAHGFQAAFGDHLISFAYDASEAVEDWWAKWGTFLSSGRGRHQSTDLQVWISRG